MRLSRRATGLAIVLSVGAGGLCRGAEESGWSRFRGPNGSGEGVAASLPAALESSHIRWSVDLGGEGHSSPVIVGGSVFVTASDRATAAQTLLCLDAATGKERWKKTFPGQTYRQHAFNSFASASCAADDERVYMVVTSDRDRWLVALTHGGEERWRFPLGAYQAQHGSGASPIVYGELVVMACDHAEAGFLVAVDRATGKERWRIERRALEAAYATPCVMKHAGGEWLVFASQAHGVTAVEPATGKIAWELGDMFPQRVVSSPVIVDGKIVVSCGVGGGGTFLAAVAPPDAEHAAARIAWKIDRTAPYVPTSVAHGGLLFAVNDGGIALCVDPSSGEVKWRERLGGGYFASPIVVNGVVYAVSRDGKLAAFRAGERFEPLGTLELGEESYATPAVAHGRMYLRTFRRLVCLGAAAG